MIKIAICDDFFDDRLAIKKIIDEFFEENNCAYKIIEFEICEEIIAEYEELNSSFDLIFLDVYTNKMNGFEAAEIIRKNDKDVPIIFATNSVEDAINGYDVNAVGYLVKPVDKNKLINILKRINIVGSNTHKEILLKVKNGYRNFKFDEINYLESNRNVVNIYTTDSQRFTIYSKLNELESKLSDPCFLRCHQSYLVNMNFVSEVDSSFIMKNGDFVPIRVKGRKEIVDKYYYYFFEK